MKLQTVYLMLLIFVVCAVLPVSGQTEKGTVILAGNTGFSFASMKLKNASDYYDLGSSTAKSFEITPEFGVFVANNFVLGMGLRYQSDTEKTGYETYTSSSFYAIPLLKFYIGKDLLKAFFYGGIGIGTSNDNSTGYGSYGSFKKNLFVYETGGGIAAFVNKNVGFEFGVAYSSVRAKYSDYSNIDRKDTAKGIGIKLGIVVCL